MYEKFIVQNKDKYVVKRTFDGIEYEYGSFDSLEEAYKKIELLEEDGWPTKIHRKEKNVIKETEMPEDTYTFGFKVGKAYKHGFLVLTRLETYELLPKLSYEDGCEIVMDGIKSNARLNFVPRIVIDKKNEELVKHLKQLSNIDPNKRGSFTLIKKEDSIVKSKEKLIEENNKLKKEINNLTKKIEDLYKYTLEK